jgi:DNA-binding transcriptional regulator GbsR (MarR family)
MGITIFTGIFELSISRGRISVPEMNADIAQYIEEWGILFENFGSTRMMGKVLGWLLICSPPHQTAKELAEAVGGSISSISMTTRTLTQAGMIERIGLPGERSAHFRLRTGTWAQLLKIRLGRLIDMRTLVERGFDFASPANASEAGRLRELQSYLLFLEEEFPSLLSRWEKQWKEKQT